MALSTVELQPPHQHRQNFEWFIRRINKKGHQPSTLIFLVRCKNRGNSAITYKVKEKKTFQSHEPHLLDTQSVIFSSMTLVWTKLPPSHTIPARIPEMIFSGFKPNKYKMWTTPLHALQRNRKCPYQLRLKIFSPGFFLISSLQH